MSPSLEKLKEQFRSLVDRHGLSHESPISIRPLGVAEAIGDPAPWRDYPLLKGKEKLIEADFGGHIGQAFTSSPAGWQGTLADVLRFDLDEERDRALFVACVNAVGRSLGLACDTIHCKDRGPALCAEKMATELEKRLPARGKIGIIGYQPAFVHALSDHFGPDRVMVSDLDPDNIGRKEAGVPIIDGATGLEVIADWADLGFATGSTLANDTLDDIVHAFETRHKPIIFFGTTIAVPAVLLGLERLCFEGA